MHCRGACPPASAEPRLRRSSDPRRIRWPERPPRGDTSLKISVVTVSFNSAATIADTLRSVAAQTHPDLEHIIIDGASTDATMDIVRKEGTHVAHAISERDKGIYDAMNKGLALATGEFVAFLNSDDRYADDRVLAEVAEAAVAGVDFVYGDIRMVNAEGQTVREWKTGVVPIGGLTSTQIPHPALFVRRRLLDQISPAFDPTLRIASDLKQQLIFINRMGAKGAYLARTLVVMSLGGASTGSLSSYIAGWRESARAYNDVFGHGGVWFTTKKVLSKLRGIRQFS